MPRLPGKMRRFTIAYNPPPKSITTECIAMEAERLNAVANRIANLEGRGDQLRRYL